MTKGKAGRPKKNIDWELLDDLISIQCTLAECCQVLKVSEPTLEGALKRTYGLTFSEYRATKKVLTKVALRRTLWQMSKKYPNVAMFLSKQPQFLGYSDRTSAEITTISPEVASKTDAELLAELGLNQEQIQAYIQMSPLAQECFLIAQNASEEG